MCLRTVVLPEPGSPWEGEGPRRRRPGPTPGSARRSGTAGSRWRLDRLPRIGERHEVGITDHVDDLAAFDQAPDPGVVGLLISRRYVPSP